MKKNNKGFFLAETIVVIALVTTVMAFVYPNVSKIYDNYKNRTFYYDQPEDIYLLKSIYEKYMDMDEDNELNDSVTLDNTIGCKVFDSTEMTEINNLSNFMSISSLKSLYVTGYMSSPTSSNYNFNKYLKRLKKTNYDPTSYRLIGVFKEGDITRFASIKLDNPNPNRNCNLGGNSWEK